MSKTSKGSAADVREQVALRRKPPRWLKVRVRPPGYEKDSLIPTIADVTAGLMFFLVAVLLWWCLNGIWGAVRAGKESVSSYTSYGVSELPDVAPRAERSYGEGSRGLNRVTEAADSFVESFTRGITELFGGGAAPRKESGIESF